MSTAGQTQTFFFFFSEVMLIPTIFQIIFSV